VGDPGTRPKVVVLKGGVSAEREVSLVTGAQVEAALDEAGLPVVCVDTSAPDFIDRIRDSGADVAFICLHGRFGEDGTIQGLLELIGMPYVGSGVLSSAMAMDKWISKLVFQAAGVPTPEALLVERGDDWDVESVISAIGEHAVVKPSREGSAIGVTIVHEAAGLPEAMRIAFEHDDAVVIEQFVEGVEITVGVVGTDEPIALPTLEIVPEHDFYDYESKYLPGMSTHIIPARLPEDVRELSKAIALEAHKALGCVGVSRVDLIVPDGGAPSVLEVNTIPGMTTTSLLPEAAQAAGIEFPDLCARLVTDAIDYWRRRARDQADWGAET
jgi:D-alanine-D-alanine ligase